MQHTKSTCRCCPVYSAYVNSVTLGQGIRCFLHKWVVGDPIHIRRISETLNLPKFVVEWANLQHVKALHGRREWRAWAWPVWGPCRCRSCRTPRTCSSSCRLLWSFSPLSWQQVPSLLEPSLPSHRPLEPLQCLFCFKSELSFVSSGFDTCLVICGLHKISRLDMFAKPKCKALSWHRTLSWFFDPPGQ